MNIKYAVAEDGTHIAYRILDGDPDSASRHDIVMVNGGLIPFEVFDEDPGIVRMLEGLRSIGRVIVFDRRSVGLSDPITDWEKPILEQWAEDLTAVVEQSGAHDVVVFAWDSFGIGSRFAARHPELLERLILFQVLGGSDKSWAEWVHHRLGGLKQSIDGADDDDLLAQLAPSRASDPSFREWYERAGRVGASPATAGRMWDLVFRTPASEQRLADVTTPTLMLFRPDNTYVPPEAAQWAASELPDATIVEVDGPDVWPFVGDVDAVVAEIADFVVGERRVPPPERVLAAVLFTDLVDSTRRAADLGDAGWKALLDRHDLAVRNAVGRCGGRVVKTTGDGVLAVFPAAGVAVRAAERMHQELAAAELEVRIGVHVGDIDQRGDDISGLAVNIAARVMAAAGPGELLATSSVVAAIAGQTEQFEPAGTHDLKGVPGKWELFRRTG